MANPQQTPQLFDELVAAPMTVVHHYVTGLHTFAADACCAIAGAHLKGGLFGARTVHPGAGFGGDTRGACFWGVREAIGIESGPAQVAFDAAIRELSDDQLANIIRHDPATTSLYPSPGIELAIGSLLSERRHFRALPWNPKAVVRQGDALSSDLLSLVDGTPADALIGNFMLHWLLVRGGTLAEALDRFAPIVRPGGVAVFSVPYQIVEGRDPVEDRLLRSRIAQSMPLYRALVTRLMPRLQKHFAAQILEMASEKMGPIVVKEADVEQGSSAFTFLQTQTVYLGAKPERVADTLRGGALYEAIYRTGLPATALASHVAECMLEAEAALTPEELLSPVSTFIRCYVFKRKD